MATALGLSASQAAADKGVQLSPAEVRTIFASNCSWCHSDFGKKAGKGPKLAGTTMNEKQILDRIVNGAPGGAMPSYKKMLSEQKITALVIYIKELPAD